MARTFMVLVVALAITASLALELNDEPVIDDELMDEDVGDLIDEEQEVELRNFPAGNIILRSDKALLIIFGKVQVEVGVVLL